MCDSCLSHFYHPERPTIHPPIMPRDFPNDPPPTPRLPRTTLSFTGEALRRENAELKYELNLRNHELIQARRAQAESELTLKALDVLCTDLLAQLNAGDRAFIYADDKGLHVVDTRRHQQYTLARFMERPAPAGGVMPAAYLALCRYPYLQDESCKLPGGHRGPHGPAHRCELDCGLSQTGCILNECREGSHYYALGAQECYCGNTGLAGSNV